MRSSLNASAGYIAGDEASRQVMDSPIDFQLGQRNRRLPALNLPLDSLETKHTFWDFVVGVPNSDPESWRPAHVVHLTAL